MATTKKKQYCLRWDDGDVYTLDKVWCEMSQTVKPMLFTTKHAASEYAHDVLCAEDCIDIVPWPLAQQPTPADLKPTDFFRADVKAVLAEVEELLVSKNLAYGDSALNPVRIFSKAEPAAQLDVRIDDKLSRIARGSNAGEDVVLDLTGYLVMKLIESRRTK
jgi:hypothetical protein